MEMIEKIEQENARHNEEIKRKLKMTRPYDHFIGLQKATTEDRITKSDLDKWYKNPNREFICIFCGSTSGTEEIRNCPRCHEYKGLMPKVEGEL
jgi:rubrerythrin